ncbi:MAG: hypothetical protein A3G60_00300 [Candidatus Ryanbacteria bacterium RIFCSPLOWO2_12_FULL_47_9c]|uniref:PrgI family protein n=1 Tax=Candidatus Ryanbacteria bacterium RIFCSPLOWO2_12_FULL_47_9c TaxID=1802131 RepID=A0A1G2H1R4_9BACT|nr:MAG: hypothetical protein UX74_C0002G0019 [Parcubacteria group bacterium GW2011_GWA2_47_10b]KKU86142.1 MAG: hypothetical protein UY14_C0006G0019 [Parcubacteria group bacterium GW2011_GWA1_47_9]OGZ45075.1 MAG: hypothetical protein A2844_02025 [Candidatus Ryanbacteria bacterium RIFCSPHIGHO2_01_FULL_48_80]OGZ50557.1 MAG: hypothetical protein A3C83_02575 [Candidatus Ryanbacteria bacterium RIFCSPHIGHO2_02_FULL_47_25]OGZ52262.1 MAG: hypothetical protein A3A29_00155 [Candidatus Ryanbacteria bacteri
MQQFQVPQYIEVEDKLFGPLTVKQFVYILGAGGFVLLLWILGLPGFIFWPIAIVAVGFFVGLAFYQVNGQPLVAVLNNALNQITHPRRYMWKREPHPLKKEQRVIEVKDPTHLPQLTAGKLKDLSWTLDVSEKLER